MSQPNDPERLPDETPEHHPSVAHERGEEDVKAVSGFGIGLAIGIVIVVFAMWGLFEWFYAREDRASPTPSPVVLSEKPQLPPEPRLQAVPRLDLKALHEGEDQVLDNYAWVDPEKGIVRIPIKDAIKIVIAKGLSSKPATDLPDAQGYRMIPSIASSGRTFEKISQ
jgi:hypothetical protein